MHTIKRRSYENDTETEVFGNHLKFQEGFYGYVSTTIEDRNASIQGVGFQISTTVSFQPSPHKSAPCHWPGLPWPRLPLSPKTNKINLSK